LATSKPPTTAWRRCERGKPECVRQGVEVGQIRDVVLRYLETNPQDRDENAWLLVVTALAKAWGCATK
jgi:hypothetical protein